MMLASLRTIPLTLLTTLLAAQEQPPVPERPDAPQELIAKVRAGGWLHTPKWRRGDDGALQVWRLGAALERDDEFVDLLGADLADGFANGGVVGWLSVWCHGPGDLLGMTDAAFHLDALGIGKSDAALREHLAKPMQGAGALGRAELLDRMLILDELRRRGCKPAVAEIQGLLAHGDTPADLRARAEATLAALRGVAAPLQRKRLAADRLELPSKLDLCVVIDHARLPDLSGLTALGRRVAALKCVEFLEPGDDTSAAMLSDVQRNCDVVSEMPFGIAHRSGNYRVDQSCLAIQMAPDAAPPFHVWWEAAGAFDAATVESVKPRLDAEQPPELPWLRPLSVTTELARGTSHDKPGRPRPDVAASLLADSGAAIRVVMPPRSAMVGLLSIAGFPLLRSGELRVSFGGGNVQLALDVVTSSEEKAAAWLARGRELIAQGDKLLASDAAKEIVAEPDLLAAARALFGAELASKGENFTARASVPIPGRRGWEVLFGTM